MRSDRFAIASAGLALAALLSLAACGELIGLGDTPPALPEGSDGGADATVDSGNDARPNDATPDTTPPEDARTDAADAGADATLDASVDASDGAPSEAGPTGGDAAPTVALGFGLDFGCARLPSGVVECWGSNAHLQQALPSDAGATGTPHVIGDHVVTLGGGVIGEQMCVGFDDGGVACWGLNDNGQAVPPSGADVPKPTFLSGVPGAAAIALGQYGSCAIDGDRKGVTCWGHFGNNADTAVQPVPGVGPDVTSLGAGGLFACAVAGDGGALCWGGNGSGQLGVPGGSGDTPIAPQGVKGVAQIAVGWLHVCALLRTGQVMCWGDNGWGEIGIGSDAGTVDVPTLVPGLTDIVQIVAGATSTCALHDGGAVSCWGGSAQGQNGLPHEAHSPETVTRVPHAIALAAGNLTTCAVLDADGSVECWGDNGNGERGDGTVGGYGADPTPLKL